MRILRMPDPAGGTPGTPATAAQPPAGGTPPLNDFVKGLPPDLHGEKCLHTMTDVNTLAKGYVHAQRLIGAKRLEAPLPTWGESEWNGFYEAAGRPKTADEYKIPEFKFESDPNLKPDAARLKAVTQELHKAGLNQKQVEATLGAYFKTVDTDLKTVKQANEQKRLQAEADLKAEWGDKYDVQLDTAKAVLQKFGDTAFMEYVNEGGGNDPRLIKTLARLGASIIEDKSRGGNAGDGLMITDATRAAAEVNRLKQDSEFQKALTQKSHPGHKAAVQQWLNVHKVASPGKQVEPE